LSAVACILVTAFLCLNPPYRPVVQHITFAPPGQQPAGPSKADIEKVGVEINIAGSHEIEFTPSTGFDKLCADAGCYYYRKSCEEARKYCSYKYDFVPAKDDKGGKPELYLEGISIGYKSAEQLKVAEENIFVQIRGDGEPVEIPLSRMKSSTSFD
jgi:hypothetical protein